MRAFYMPLGVPSFGAQAYVPKHDPNCHCEWSQRYWERQRDAECIVQNLKDNPYPAGAADPLVALEAAHAAVARLRLAGATQ